MDPLDSLLALEHLGIKFGLENIRTLCAALGNPQSRYRAVIVAGTNGKGSVTAMVDRALTSAGLRSGRYTSPHLVHLEERFALDGRPVDTATLRRVAADVLAAVERLRAAGDLPAEPTFFEVCTAIAFEVFLRGGVDVAVLEVGMGGRFDATNVAEPCAAAITSIDLDHERFLGHTIAEIAFEKAGVIKPGMTVIVGETGRDALDVIGAACRERGARLVGATSDVVSSVSIKEGCTVLDVRTPVREYPPMRLPLRGRHQVLNALVALRLLEALPALGIELPSEAIVAGLTTVRWPGRLDLVRLADGRQLLLDAAHNPAGAGVLAEYLKETFTERLPIVFGAMRDKNAAAMLALLAPCASGFVFTEPPNARAFTAPALAHLAAAAAPSVPVDIEPVPERAVVRAFERGPVVVAAGSIFLVGDLLSRIPSNPLS
jgi:dihydrofolate synthase/folylpolyglutamate synthase